MAARVSPCSSVFFSLAGLAHFMIGNAPGMKRRFHLLAGLLLCVLAACARAPEVLLLDGQHVPDVLTEQRRIAQPPSLGGNRFLTGWWPWQHEGRLVLSSPKPRARVRLEMVNLGGAPRTLLLDVLQPPIPSGFPCPPVSPWEGCQWIWSPTGGFVASSARA